MEGTLVAMIAGRTFDWTGLRQGLHRLQARLIKLARHHPAPPDRLFRPQIAGNEQISNQIYRLSEQMGGMLRDMYHSSTVKTLTAQVQELQGDLFSARLALDEATRAMRLQGRDKPRPPASPPATNRILQLNSLVLTPLRCRAHVSGQWIEVDASGEDPQLHLPVMQGCGGKVQLRLSWMAETDTALQVYWAIGDCGFSPEQVHTGPPGDGLQTASLLFEVPDGEALQIRIDPTTGPGKSRLRGSLGGMFVLLGARVDAEAPEVKASGPFLKKRTKKLSSVGASGVSGADRRE
jgi:hypothetical protein